MAPAPLRGLRVVDLTSTFMGPYCTMLLSQWGADIVKVEQPTGDVVRYIGDHRGSGMGPIFLGTNRGKRSLALDLKVPQSRAVLTRLIENCDIFVHNMRPLAARRLNLSGADVLGLNPRVVYLGFRGYGPGGPYQDLPAYDDVIQAVSGLADMQDPDDPKYIRSSIADKIVGLVGAASVLAAVHGREATGEGGIIEIPMFETMVGFNLLEQQGGRVFETPSGPAGYARTKSVNRKPYRTKDGTIAVMIYTDAQWRSFFEVIGRPQLASDERFTTINERTVYNDELYAIVDEVMIARTTDDWLEQLEMIGVAASRVNSIDALFTDPHLTATDFFRRVEHPSEGGILLPHLPGPTGDGQSDSTWFAPLLGQHNRQVLAELGYVDDEIDELLRSGAVAAAVVDEAHRD